MMRVLSGARLAVFGLGLNASTIGAFLALGYLDLRYPDGRKVVNHPDLYDVVYDVPRWMLGFGVGLFSVGLLFVVLAWSTSPRWQEGPLHRLWGRTLASMVLSGWSTSVVVAVLGRESAEVRTWVIFVVMVPVATVLALVWMWARAGR